MASIRRRGNRYDVRYRDPEGAERTRTFAKKGDATGFAATVEADKLRGTYIDPAAGKVTFEGFAETWLHAQTFDVSTREQTEVRLRVHAYPVLGRKQLRHVKPSTIQAWLRGLEHLAPSTRRVIFVNVASVFAAAVDDGEIIRNPCRVPSVHAPQVARRKVVPWTVEQVHALTEALPDRYAILATIIAGLGLRQGEAFGLAVEDVDFLRGKVEIRQQVKLLADGTQLYAAPKGGKTRTVPLPGSVRDAIAAHLAAYPPQPVTLAWADRGGKEVTVSPIISTRLRHAVNRDRFNRDTWKIALDAAGIPRTRENGCHALRHFYASTLLDAGESIRALAEYLGHHDPGFTLRTYTHLMPASDERTKSAIDAVFRGIHATFMPQTNENQ